MGELGFMGMMVPEEWSGAGFDTLTYVIAMEEIAAVELATSTIMSVNNSLVCQLLVDYGTEDQNAFEVEARVEDSDGNELWSQTKMVTNLQSGEERTLNWEWDSETPREVTVIVETL